MAAKKRKPKKGRDRRSRQRLFRNHARRTKAHLPPGSEIRFEPEGQVKMSEVLKAFVEPYLELADTERALRVLFQVAMVAWNAALLPEEEREALLDETIARGFAQASEDAQAGMRAILGKMVERKLAWFDENRRFIVSVEVKRTGETDHVSVVSTPGQPEPE